MKLSIIIVSYNVREFLEQALLSLEKAVQNIESEIIVVDNASSDGTVEFVCKNFPHVELITSDENLGFARANNLAIQKSTGEFVCLINPDTIVQEDTFSQLFDFFENNKDAGCVTCRVLNPDGSLQLACRRSYPTPWVSFTKITGLSTLFPKSKLFGKYNLTYLDPEQSNAVDAISGAFMLLRRHVVNEVGGLDEDFFMYGEDLDWCYRIQTSGFKIYYVPTTQIIHFKGESSKKSPFQQRRLFYEAMRLFVNKHFKKGTAILPSWILILAIYASASISYLKTAFQKMLWPLVDFVMLTISMAVAISLRFHPEFPWKEYLLVHLVYSCIWLLALFSHRVHSRNVLSGLKAFSAVLFGLIINSALTFFFNSYAFSRLVILAAGAVNLLLVPGWRLLLKYLAVRNVSILPNSVKSLLLNRRSLVVGDAKTLSTIVQKINNDSSSPYSIKGVVLASGKVEKQKIENLPIWGTIEELPAIIKREHVHEVIFSTNGLPYEKMLNAMANSIDSQISFKMIPSNVDVVIGKATMEYIQDIPVVDIDYKVQNEFYQFVKRLMDITFSLVGLILLIVSLPFSLRHGRKKIAVQTSKNTSIDVFKFNHARAKWWNRLPFFWYILHGDFSLVGRNPELPVKEEVAFAIKPGIFNVEILDRHFHGSIPENGHYLFYLKNYTPLIDIKIIVKSIFQK